ncbi:hypothetical protein SELMODRAFT_413389 [Selaginella moellendorffii]|uniref:Mitochondrial carrier protein n=1 Tax=Selaginella moellendorffii TaxID=88036 RepID=D8RPA5_SELML|nr:solute carrier family 25 member 44 [Selaginella moellendorffii]XP_002984362.1 solute carrier family 25 member 44 [Selaginella moellendorffii]EFJ14412.1 hypothetical protein SELMODRAFT_423544 [Selaginella moellendorffii]EFJ26005.1 hypothetical protein SELMODRAFT_413389 [Selaginella moellendorffii]|eukprot:XP_002972784.1 solute carrier family 25 member 44 [Selaginella moellendorffii]
MELEARVGKHEIRLPAEVNWEMLDKTKFFVLGAALFSGVNGMLYPSMVLKTQQQVIGPAAASSSSSSIAAGILRRQGILGLYKGFGASLMGTIPARAIYMSTLEITKSALGSLADRSPAAAAAANAVAGMSAAMAAQLVWTPVDVISQRLMVQGAGQGAAIATNYKGAMDALATIARNSGIRGLYRGFGVSIITYAPSNAVWWGSYSIAQRFMWKGAAAVTDLGDRREDVSGGVVLGMQAASAAMAGGVSALVTTPLDTIKTRMQVLESGRPPRFGTTLRDLVSEGGWRACYKGLGPRWASMTLSATAMITSYELLKRLSAKSQ